MRLRNLTLHAGTPATPIHLTGCDNPLTVIHHPDPDRSLGRQLDRAIGYVLFGLGRGQDGHLADARLGLVTHEGEYLVGRHAGNTESGALWVETTRGDYDEAEPVRQRLAAVPPLAGKTLYSVDFHRGALLDLLTSDPFIRGFNAPLRRKPLTDAVGKEELLRKRNALAEQIEAALAVSRRQSTQLTENIASVEREIAEAERKVSQLRDRLHGLESAAGAASAEALRGEIAAHAGTLSREEQERIQREAAELDTQITSCRTTLSVLEERSQWLQRKLAETQPGGRGDDPAGVFQLREAVGAFERVLDALDGEIGSIAAAVESDRPIDRSAHARLQPLATVLREQLYALCGSVSEQQKAQQRRNLHAESRQLQRAQTELADRLQLLLSQREALAAPLHTHWSPQAQPPSLGHCQCERHAGFVARLHGADGGPTNKQLLEADRRRLIAELRDLEDRLAELRSRRTTLTNERAGLVGNTRLDALRGELARIESELREAESGPKPQTRSVLHASDLVAVLTGGELAQIRPERDGRSITVVDRRGNRLGVDRLDATRQHQVFLAMQLAMVDAWAAAGIDLPVVLVSPTERLDAPGRTALAGVLSGFSQRGRQVVVFTDDPEAVECFVGRGAVERRFGQAAEPPQAQPAAVSQRLRVVREPRDGSSSYRETTDCDAAPGEEVFYLTPESQMHAFPVLGDETGEAFRAAGIITVADLLEVEPHVLAERLARPRITAATVQLWQTHTRLLCSVPGVTLADAQVLAACGFGPLEKLAAASADHVRDRVDEVLATEEGRRFSRAAAYLTTDRIAAWIAAAGRVVAHGTQPEPKQESPAAKPAAGPTVKRKQYKFFLSLDSPVEDAPSIGPKTADKLASVGIRTVADLLHADAESTAEELDDRHISESVLVAWQHQARLVCRVPNLRGFGAQLLVACGYTDAEQIAGADEDEFVRQLTDFCATKAGQRILRDSQPPSESRIAGWITNAAHARSLEAA